MSSTERTSVRTQPRNSQAPVSHRLQSCCFYEMCLSRSLGKLRRDPQSDGSDRSKVRDTKERLLPIPYLWLTLHSFTTTASHHHALPSLSFPDIRDDQIPAENKAGCLKVTTTQLCGIPSGNEIFI